MSSLQGRRKELMLLVRFTRAVTVRFDDFASFRQTASAPWSGGARRAAVVCLLRADRWEAYIVLVVESKRASKPQRLEEQRTLQFPNASSCLKGWSAALCSLAGLGGQRMILSEQQDGR